MEKRDHIEGFTLLASVWGFFRKCLFSVLSFGPMPKHVAFIMDGNRRFAKSRGIKQRGGYEAGSSSLSSTLRYSYEMGIKHVTVYAFSIENFKREPEEVQCVMRLLQEKIEEFLKKESIVDKYGIRIKFWGNLSLLDETVRLTAEKAMSSTAKNSGPVLSVCVAYTSTDEIRNAIQKSCAEKNGNGHDENMGKVITVDDLEQHFYTADCPDPDILIRTSGESRLSNFLLWQTTSTHLQNPSPMWPEFSLVYLVLAILKYQKAYSYLKETSSRSKMMQ